EQLLHVEIDPRHDVLVEERRQPCVAEQLLAVAQERAISGRRVTGDEAKPEAPSARLEHGVAHQRDGVAAPAQLLADLQEWKHVNGAPPHMDDDITGWRHALRRYQM